MKVLRILLLEDSLLDAELILANLNDGGIQCELVRVETRSEFTTILETSPLDLILSDYSLPSFDGFSALKIARAVCPDVPFIFISGALGEEVAIETLKNGATDYVLKQRLERLVPSVQRALREAKERSDRKQAEAALKDALQKLYFHVENSPLAVIEWDRNFRVLRWSQEAEKIFGWTFSEVFGLKPTEWKFVFEEDIKPVNEVISNLIAGQQKRNISHNRNYKKNGSIVYCEWYNSALLDEDGNLLSVLSLALDVTERKQAEEERYRREQEFKALAENSPDIIARFDRESRYLYVNPAIELATGIAAQEFIGKSSAQLGFPKHIYNSWHEHIQKVFETARESCVEFDFPLDKEIHYYQSRLVPEFALDGSVESVLGITRDVTNYKELEKQLRHQAEELAKANRLKDEFLAVLSHELRSPLNPIVGWAKLLRSRKFDEATTARAMEIIERNAKVQTQLIEDLLDISRIIQGKISLHIVHVNLTSTIEAALDTVRLVAEAKSIQIHPLIDRNVGLVSGDANRLQQIVWNLLSNAIKFTPEGGRVEIELSVAENQETTAQYAQIRVTDRGKGINAEFLPYVFDSFRQADASTTRKHGGLGLGLAIVRRLVELHGGNVCVKSPGEGLGATFMVRLPCVKEAKFIPDSPVVRDRSLSPIPLEGLRVLVVDDDTDSREFITFVLEQYGAQTTAVSSASEGFQEIMEWQPDVLVSDIGMPQEDGYSLIRKVRDLEAKQSRQIPAIALTAYARDEDSKQAIAAGFQMHIAKPVEPSQLIKAVADVAARTDKVRS